jgi:hypothetical protein
MLSDAWIELVEQVLHDEAQLLESLGAHQAGPASLDLFDDRPAGSDRAPP